VEDSDKVDGVVRLHMAGQYFIFLTRRTSLEYDDRSKGDMRHPLDILQTIESLNNADQTVDSGTVVAGLQSCIGQERWRRGVHAQYTKRPRV
jgi:hypothetical protein